MNTDLSVDLHAEAGAYPYARIPVRDASIRLDAGGHNFVITWLEPGPTSTDPWVERSEQVYDRPDSARDSGDEQLGNILWRRGMNLALCGFQRGDGGFDGGGPDRHHQVRFSVLDERGNPVDVAMFRRAHHSLPYLAFQPESESRVGGARVA